MTNFCFWPEAAVANLCNEQIFNAKASGADAALELGVSATAIWTVAPKNLRDASRHELLPPNLRSR
jgi:hypothetical protein